MEAQADAKRPYRTTLRDEQAQITRRRILQTARRLFLERGYGQVTMQEVATDAGVAYQTVFAQFGSKLQLALELCASEFPHVGQTLTMLIEARAAGDPEAWLRTMGAFARELYEPCAEILRFMRESGDPDLLARYQEIDAGRLELLAELGPQLEKTNKLRPGMTGKAAVDVVWTMSSPVTYERLVLDRGWTPKHFESWLGPALVDLVLAG